MVRPNPFLSTQLQVIISRAECEANVKGFANAKFKKFRTESEAQAFVNSHATQPAQRFFQSDNAQSSYRPKTNPGFSGSSSSSSGSPSQEKKFSIAKASKR